MAVVMILFEEIYLAGAAEVLTLVLAEEEAIMLMVVEEAMEELLMAAFQWIFLCQWSRFPWSSC
jgi:hypothetical protein